MRFKTFIAMVLIFCAGFAWAQSSADAAPNPGSGGARAMGDVIAQFDVQTPTGDNQLLGVEYANGSFWVTGGNSGGDPNQLYQFDSAGNLLNQWDQASDPGWGWRDLAFDGTYLYASDSGVIEQIDPNTGMATGVTIPSPINPARALAYDPATDHFFTASFSSDIYEIDRTGAVINQAANSLSLYGFAWDPSGPYLWGWSQDGTPLCTATQMDPATLTPTGVAFLGIDPPGGLAGGACISTDFQTGMVAFIGLHQADVNDAIVVYELTDFLAIPTLGTWGLIAFLVALGGAGLIILRRRA